MASAALGATLTGSPAQAAPATCTDASFGGTYYCGYGERNFTFSNGTYEVWVIGTDYSIWTRWRSNGSYSSWVNQGGQIRRSYASGDFVRITCGSNPIIEVVGTDNRWYSNARRTDGSWSGWVLGNTWVCP